MYIRYFILFCLAIYLLVISNEITSLCSPVLYLLKKAREKLRSAPNGVSTHYKGVMENSFFPIFPIMAGLLAGLDSVAGIIQAVSMVVCLASLLGAVFQGFHERSVGGVEIGAHDRGNSGIVLDNRDRCLHRGWI